MAADKNLSPQLSETGKLDLTARATAALNQWERPIIFEFDMQNVVAMIGQLQLAFRHPLNVGPSRQMTEKFVRDLIAQIDPEHGDVYQFLMLGFDGRYDE